jgi:3-hydroxybutyryl-CoA dehydratase
MAQPQTHEANTFETDFWKDANLRKMWDDIVPGVPRKTIPYTLTREAIELYCRSVGETHPLYFDEAYARTTRYGGLIAPPSIHILLMFSCTPADDWMRSPGTVNAGQSWSGRATSSPCRRARSTSSSSANGCSWCTTTSSSTSTAR